MSPLTDQVVDWGVCWQLREGRQELMRFNWSVSCQLSLVPHLTLSDGVSLLHLQGHECLREGVSEWARESYRETLDIYSGCAWNRWCMCACERKRGCGVYVCAACVIESKCYLGSPWGVVVIPLWSIGRNPSRAKHTHFTLLPLRTHVQPVFPNTLLACVGHFCKHCVAYKGA